MDRPAPRLTSVMGVARALLATLDTRESVAVLMAEFGWDATFQALALLRGDGAEEAFAVAWEQLLTQPMEQQLRDVHWRSQAWLNEA